MKLAERARRPETRQNLLTMAEVWIKLAAEIECDQVLLSTFAEMDFGKPYDALPIALKLYSRVT